MRIAKSSNIKILLLILGYGIFGLVGAQTSTPTGPLIDYLNAITTYNATTLGNSNDIPHLPNPTMYGIVQRMVKLTTSVADTGTLILPYQGDQFAKGSNIPLKIVYSVFQTSGSVTPVLYTVTTSKLQSLLPAGATSFTLPNATTKGPLTAIFGDPAPGKTKYLYVQYSYDINKCPALNTLFYNKMLAFYDNRPLDTTAAADAAYVNKLIGFFSDTSSVLSYYTLLTGGDAFYNGNPPTGQIKNLKDRADVMRLELKLMPTVNGIKSGSIDISQFMDPNNATYATARTDAIALRKLKAALTI